MRPRHLRSRTAAVLLILFGLPTDRAVAESTPPQDFLRLAPTVTFQDQALPAYYWVGSPRTTGPTATFLSGSGVLSLDAEPVGDRVLLRATCAACQWLEVSLHRTQGAIELIPTIEPPDYTRGYRLPRQPVGAPVFQQRVELPSELAQEWSRGVAAVGREGAPLANLGAIEAGLGVARRGEGWSAGIRPRARPVHPGELALRLDELDPIPEVAGSESPYVVLVGDSFLELNREVGDLAVGTYLAEVRSNRGVGSVAFLLTRLQALPRIDGEGLFLRTLDRVEGDPLGEVDVLLHARSEEAPRPAPVAGRTDAQGVVRLPLPPGIAEAVLELRRGEDRAVRSLSLHRPPAPPEVRDGVLRLEADRRLVRPGDPIHLYGFGREIGTDDRLSIPSDATVEFSVRAQETGFSGEHPRLAPNPVPLGPDGRFHLAWQIPSGCPDGVLGVSALLRGPRPPGRESGAILGSGWLQVEVLSYEAGHYRITVGTEGTPIAPGEALVFPIEARYRSGQPLAGAPLRWALQREVRVGPGEDPFRERLEALSIAPGITGGSLLPDLWSVRDDLPEGLALRGGGTLDARGRAMVRLETPPTTSPGPFHLTAWVRTPEGEELAARGAVWVLDRDRLLGIRGPAGRFDYGEDEAVSLQVLARDLSGNSVDGPVRVEIRSSVPGVEPLPLREVRSLRLRDGRAELVLNPPRDEDLRVEATLADSRGRAVQARTHVRRTRVWGSRRGMSGTLEVVKPTHELQAGELATIRVRSPRRDGLVHWALEGVRVEATGVATLVDHEARIALPVPADGRTAAILRVDSVDQGQHRFGACSLPVAHPEGTVQLEVHGPGRAVFPGEVVELEVVAQVEGGPPFEGAGFLRVAAEGLVAGPYRGGIARDLGLYRPNRVVDPDGRSSCSMGIVDASGGPTSLEATRKVGPVPGTALFVETLRFDPGGSARVPFRVPVGPTTWMVRAVVGDSRHRFAEAEAALEVRDPVALSCQLPPHLTSGDHLELPCLIENLGDRDYSGVLALEARGPLELGQASRAPHPGEDHTWTGQPRGFRPLGADRWQVALPSRASLPVVVPVVAGETEVHAEVALRYRLEGSGRSRTREAQSMVHPRGPVGFRRTWVRVGPDGPEPGPGPQVGSRGARDLGVRIAPDAPWAIEAMLRDEVCLALDLPLPSGGFRRSARPQGPVEVVAALRMVATAEAWLGKERLDAVADPQRRESYRRATVEALVSDLAETRWRALADGDLLALLQEVLAMPGALRRDLEARLDLAAWADALEARYRHDLAEAPEETLELARAYQVLARAGRRVEPPRRVSATLPAVFWLHRALGAESLGQRDVVERAVEELDRLERRALGVRTWNWKRGVEYESPEFWEDVRRGPQYWAQAPPIQALDLWTRRAREGALEASRFAEILRAVTIEFGAVVRGNGFPMPELSTLEALGRPTGPPTGGGALRLAAGGRSILVRGSPATYLLPETPLGAPWLAPGAALSLQLVDPTPVQALLCFEEPVAGGGDPHLVRVESVVSVREEGAGPITDMVRTVTVRRLAPEAPRAFTATIPLPAGGRVRGRVVVECAKKGTPAELEKVHPQAEVREDAVVVDLPWEMETACRIQVPLQVRFRGTRWLRPARAHVTGRPEAAWFSDAALLAVGVGR